MVSWVSLGDTTGTQPSSTACFRHPQATKNAPTLPTGSYETTPTSPRSPMDTGRTPPPTGVLSPLFVRKGLLSGHGSCRRHLPGSIPSGGGAASGCRYVSAESSRRTNDGGGLSPPCRLESLSLQWPDTHLAWPGPRVSAVRLHSSDRQVAARWGVSPSQDPGTSLPGRTASLRGPGEQTAGHIKSLQVR